MRRQQLRLALDAGLLLSCALSVAAVPSVNVELRASFGAPPLLLELLETAAEENATAYFPLLDRIADGYFDTATTDEELYKSFRTLLKEDGHLSEPEDLSSFDFALSIHSAAPRIEAYLQYYNTSVSPWLGESDGAECESWVYTPFSGQRHCSPDLDASSATPLGKPGDALHQLPFDRVLGNPASDMASVLYGDIMSPSFREFHKTVSQTAKDGSTSYRVRYRPTPRSFTALTVSGYGVELALKRTDYIVIDDRKADDDQAEQVPQSQQAMLSDEALSDLRPLSASELLRLDFKAASFVMGSDDPFDTLERLTQDFPKHSSTMAAMNVSQEFLQEHRSNREMIVPAGFNVLWINGVQIMARDVDAFALLELLRRERKMIKGVRELGLSGPEAIDLLSHEAITASSREQEMPRYDWRDEQEGGNVILWLNDIEKDKRYADFPSNVGALLQRTYRGQLPSIRKDIHNVVVPIDFSSFEDIRFVLEGLQSFVKRKLAVRFGLVPVVSTPAASEQAKAVQYLLDAYGLAAMINYLERSAAASGKSIISPSQQHFNKATEGRSLRAGQEQLSLVQVLETPIYNERLHEVKQYLKRLGLLDHSLSVFVNGAPIPKTDEWLQTMSDKLSTDLGLVQRAVFEETITDDDYIPEIFLYHASQRRIPSVIPEDDKDERHLDLGDFTELSQLPTLSASDDNIERELVHLTIVADIRSRFGFDQMMEALGFWETHDNVELAFLSINSSFVEKVDARPDASKQMRADFLVSLLKEYGSRKGLTDMHSSDDASGVVREPFYEKVRQALTDMGSPGADRESMFEKVRSRDQLFEKAANDYASLESNRALWEKITKATGLSAGQNALILNGRFIGPFSDDVVLNAGDLEVLFSYERKKRLLPASLAIHGLGLDDRAASPFAFAKVSNLIARSLVSDVPEGIFEAAPSVRMSAFNNWQSAYTAIKVGNIASANIQIIAAIDPATEVAQRWIPIIKCLSELEGVYTALYLNPRERLEELPVRRFYRYVLSSTPAFAKDGSLQHRMAAFGGLPAEALLNIGMDLPPSWLVAPQKSVHDLDNIKLSAVQSGNDIEAIYELEHILIEGHSREGTASAPPRGAQLVLGTDLDAHSADTIIMANLGYFQFKGNPGVYNLAMQEGRSDEVFKIDSAGTLGYSAQSGDNSSEIALTNFRGATLFPRLSRKSGMEAEDVLEPSRTPLESLAEGADRLLAQAGLHGAHGSKYLSKAAKFGSDLLSGFSKPAGSAPEPHADINIFSVASGHLYERMLNIMMLSVMKHTTHTVKFWFIEQFLSPSFKDFLPILAEEYGFRYEMVTYKWPHWLRGQKEKQREIWGYKILFLDVLFPLDLDKVIFVDADQIVRTDMYELVEHDLKGAPYGFTPMCDSRTEMEGFRFWKQGYWKNYLKDLPYHISALYVVDLKKFRQIAAGDRLRQQYQMLSADPASLSNLDQDLPNHMQHMLPIHSLPQEWLWCETWCSDEALKEAKTIDLCNNPQTKEPKLDRARRQVPEWTIYDDEIAAVAKKHHERSAQGRPIAGDASDAGVQGEEESIQEQLQREDAEKEAKKHVIDEL